MGVDNYAHRPNAVGFVMFGGDRVANLTVTVSHDETAVTLEAEDRYSPDILDDLCRRASATLVATMIQLLALVDDDT